jgi:hypothetical protein
MQHTPNGSFIRVGQRKRPQAVIAVDLAVHCAVTRFEPVVAATRIDITLDETAQKPGGETPPARALQTG